MVKIFINYYDVIKYSFSNVISISSCSYKNIMWTKIIENCINWVVTFLFYTYTLGFKTKR